MKLDDVLNKLYQDLNRPMIFQVRQYFEKYSEVVSVSFIDEEIGKSVGSVRIILDLRKGKKYSQGIKISPLGFELGLSFNYFSDLMEKWNDFEDILEGEWFLKIELPKFRKKENVDVPKIKKVSSRTASRFVVISFLVILALALYGSIRAIGFSSNLSSLENNVSDLKTDLDNTKDEQQQLFDNYALNSYVQDF